MKLLYKAVSKEGKTVSGEIEAKDQEEAAIFLRRREFLPIKIAPKEAGGILKYLSRSKTTSTDLVFFTGQLASMITAGLTLMQSLTILRDQIHNERMSEIVSGVISDVEEGRQLSDALAKYPSTFSSIYISLIRASESSGLLDKVLLRLADNLEKEEKLRGTIKSALMYPTIVIIGMILVLSVMMIFVIPQLSVLYENLGVELPLPTLIVVGMSNFFINFWPVVLGAVFLGFFLYTRWHATPSGKLVMDDLVLKIPIFGPLLKESILAEFSRTFGLLVGTGTLVVEALNQSSDVAGNILYKNAIINVSRRVEKGISVGDAMSAYSLFPAILIQTVKIGEQTGKLDESMTKISGYFEGEVNQKVKTLTTAMEPFIMVVLGLGVAFLIISIIVPIYNLTSAIQ